MATTTPPTDLSLNVAVSPDGSELVCNWHYPTTYILNNLKTVNVNVDLGIGSTVEQFSVSPSSLQTFTITGDSITSCATHHVYVTYYYNSIFYTFW